LRAAEIRGVIRLIVFRNLECRERSAPLLPPTVDMEPAGGFLKDLNSLKMFSSLFSPNPSRSRNLPLRASAHLLDGPGFKCSRASATFSPSDCNSTIGESRIFFGTLAQE